MAAAVRRSPRKQPFFPKGAHVKLKIANLEGRNAQLKKKGLPEIQTDVVIEKKVLAKTKREYIVFFVGRNGFAKKTHTEMVYPVYKPGDVVHIKQKGCWVDAVIKQQLADVQYKEKKNRKDNKQDGGAVPVYECWSADDMLKADTTEGGEFPIKAFDMRSRTWRDRVLIDLMWEHQVKMCVPFADEDFVWGRTEPLYDEKSATSKIQISATPEESATPAKSATPDESLSAPAAKKRKVQTQKTTVRKKKKTVKETEDEEEKSPKFLAAEHLTAMLRGPPCMQPGEGPGDDGWTAVMTYVRIYVPGTRRVLGLELG